MTEDSAGRIGRRGALALLVIIWGIIIIATDERNVMQWFPFVSHGEVEGTRFIRTTNESESIPPADGNESKGSVEVSGEITKSEIKSNEDQAEADNLVKGSYAPTVSLVPSSGSRSPSTGAPSTADLRTLPPQERALYAPSSRPTTVPKIRGATSHPTSSIVSPLAVNQPAPPRPALRKFVCLADNETLWELRRQYARNLTQESCGTLPRMGAYRGTGEPVAVIFTIAQAKNEAYRRLVTFNAVQASKFNDLVYIVVLGADTWNLARDTTLEQNHIKVFVHNETSDPLMVAMQSFNSSLYVHKSRNPYTYELFCFQRWFAIAKFVEIKNIDIAFVVDSDILLLTNVTHEHDLCYNGCPLGAPAPLATFSAFWSKATLHKFTEYIRYLYQSKRYELLYRWPSFSDMEAMTDFILQANSTPPECIQADTRPYNLGNTSNWHLIQGKATFDNMNFREYYGNFFQDDQLQMPYLYGYKGYMRNYYLKSLHFQGGGKADLLSCISQQQSGRKLGDEADLYSSVMQGRYWRSPLEPSIGAVERNGFPSVNE